MCLAVDADVTNRILRRLEKEKTITYYKILVYRLMNYNYAKGIHETTGYFSPYESMEYYLGVNKSDRLITNTVQLTGHIISGIHVCVSRNSARIMVRHLKDSKHSRCRIVPVRCKKEHFVGAGYWERDDSCMNAVFTEVTITRETARKFKIRRDKTCV